MARTLDDRIPMAPLPAHQAFRTLRFAFAVAPIAMGADKFFNLLAPWSHYLAPAIAQMLPVSPDAFMRVAGAGEIIAGLIVAVDPVVGGWLVAAWLWAIIINLLFARGYYDVAIRDFGLSLAAVALARLGAAFAVHVEHGAFREGSRPAA
ncbi:MAG TPA: hypothetical protein VGZ23_13140 [bacterium]|nr:hypothetical protein [bacterium]